ncbi:MAG: HlyC/CorC family transporter [Chromatiales bacterium]|nr:HlyC/CorC family transporter [Chromatiales bacterium]MDH4014294.1 HlyC/CorC family transporter [Chromatiales bacterium]PLX56622.1 MAG: magnesium/cobalt efflux protein [Chromatiales bacterium]
MNEDVPLSLLFSLLVFLLLLSAFFSSSETALMTLNRYRLRHQARAGNRSAKLIETLLSRPDRLIGLILLGNNLVNIFAASLTTIIAIRIGGDSAIAAGALILTVVILIFAEVTPKTLAALQPERVAKPAAYVYYPLLKLTYPVVWLLNAISNGILLLLGVSPKKLSGDALSQEELRTVVMEASSLIPRRHKRMLLSILDLENVAVDDVMVPRNEIVGLDLDNSIDEILSQLQSSPHTRLPLYRENLDNILGIVHIRKLARLLTSGRLDRDSLCDLAREPYFVPEGTPLHVQLVNFQASKRRYALVVDEYGDIQGLVTLEDILEEIVGEFTAMPITLYQEADRQPDGSYVVSGTANIRDLNRSLNWDLPTDGAKTVNGLILEELETIPSPGTTLDIDGFSIAIMQTADKAVKTVRIRSTDS